jgi:LacI family transcriptional regulator
MVTLKEISAAVGVSQATVSRVLNFDATLSVSAQVRRAIIETAEALNYETPRMRNRTAPLGLTKVALVHFLRPEQELADPYYIGLRLGIERRAAALKIETVKVYHTESLPDPALLEGADGAIAIGWQSENEVNWLASRSRHLCFADFSPSGERFDSVESDLVVATRKLLDALTALDYRRIGFVGWAERSERGPVDGPEKRCRAYIDWMTGRGQFDKALCLTGENTEESGHRLTLSLLDSGVPVDAIVTANDNMAVGAYRALNERGLVVPRDIAVASFNDISVAQFLSPPLTTVRLPSEEIGETAVDLLVERAAGREIGKRVVLASQLVWRESTRVPTQA